MKHTRIFTLLFCSIVLLSGCNSEHGNDELKQEIARLKKESKENPYDFDVHMTSMYDSDLGCINRKDRIWQDMILRPEIGSFSADFYNYGGDIRLFYGFRNDCFVPLGHIQAMGHVEDMHSLSFSRIIEDEKYGLYAIVDWEVDNRILKDIYMTPMAYHAYRTRSGDENLIFVQFTGDNKLMNVIFQGDSFARIMVKYHSNDIGNGLFPGAGKSGHGQFWHQY